MGSALFLAATMASRALPQRHHAVPGVIKAVDYDARAITLVPPKGDSSVFSTVVPQHQR